jgi:hypothetical protein
MHWTYQSLADSVFVSFRRVYQYRCNAIFCSGMTSDVFWLIDGANLCPVNRAHW